MLFYFSMLLFCICNSMYYRIATEACLKGTKKDAIFDFADYPGACC